MRTIGRAIIFCEETFRQTAARLMGVCLLNFGVEVKDMKGCEWH